MSLIKWINKKNLIRYDKLLGLYPPFLFNGAKIRFYNNYRKIVLKIPLRWYNKNNNGVMFGGAMCLLSDPFPALIFEKIIEGSSAWTRKQTIKYIRPAKTSVEAVIELSENEINTLREQLNEKGIAIQDFKYFFCDKKGQQVAQVTNSTYLRRSN